jgi:hypothetical protein
LEKEAERVVFSEEERAGTVGAAWDAGEDCLETAGELQVEENTGPDTGTSMCLL